MKDGLDVALDHVAELRTQIARVEHERDTLMQALRDIVQHESRVGVRGTTHRIATEALERLQTKPEESDGKASSGTDKNGWRKPQLTSGSNPGAHAGTGVESGSSSLPKCGTCGGAGCMNKEPCYCIGGCRDKCTECDGVGTRGGKR